jgi:hypothetical protein
VLAFAVILERRTSEMAVEVLVAAGLSGEPISAFTHERGVRCWKRSEVLRSSSGTMQLRRKASTIAERCLKVAGAFRPRRR